MRTATHGALGAPNALGAYDARTAPDVHALDGLEASHQRSATYPSPNDFGRPSRATDGECEPPRTGSRRVCRSHSDSGAARDEATSGSSYRAERLRWLWLLFASLALTGCGFHLQGSTPLPEGSRKLYIAASDELTPFAVELRNAIERSGGTIAPTSKEADMVVRVQKDVSGRRILSVSARNTPQEYELFYQVEYTVDRAGKELLELQPLEMIRNMSFEESQVLAKDREEAILREAMAKDLALLVMRRLESLPPMPAPSPSPPGG